jgi:glycosyltransferase involved in cell wall biosynthesis
MASSRACLKWRKLPEPNLLTAMFNASKLRVVHIIAQLRAGAGRYVVDTATAQHQREPGTVAVVVSANAEAPWQSSQKLIAELRSVDVPVFCCGDFFHRDSTGLRAASQALRDALFGLGATWPQTTVVHAHTAMAGLIAKWAGAPRVVVTCHGWGHRRPLDHDLQDALAYSLCDGICSPSEAWAATIRDKTPIENVPVFPYGINLHRIPAAAVERCTERAFRIVCVAELSPRKGCDVLLHAAPLVWQRLPDVEFHFVGDGDQADALQRTAQIIDPSGHRIHFHGAVDDATAMLGAFDLFALPTRSDNQPIAIIEAMAAGLAVVSTRVGGIPQVVADSGCGLVVPPDDPVAFAEALVELLSMPEQQRRHFGTRGRAYVATFDIDSHLRVLDDFYMGRNTDPPVSRPLISGPIRRNLGASSERPVETSVSASFVCHHPPRGTA